MLRLLSTNKATMNSAGVVLFLWGLSICVSPALQNSAFGQKIYWSNVQGDTIERANPDGTDREVLVSGAGDFELRGLHVDPQLGQLFWFTKLVTSFYKIQTATLEGNGIMDVADNGFGIPLDLYVDADEGKIYWTHNIPLMDGVDEIRCVNLDGSNLQILIDGLDTADDIHVDTLNGFIYWTEQNGQRIARVELDGTNPMTIISTSASLGINSMALDHTNAMIYWTEPNSLLIRRANLDGSNPQTVLQLSGNERPFGIAIDGNGHIYWTELDTDRIRRATVDGKDVTTIVSETDGPRDILFVADAIIGDVNGDGVLDLLDVAPFIKILTSGVFQVVADINEDGVVDLLDVGPFVDLLAGG